jgi:hypothetical protein
LPHIASITASGVQVRWQHDKVTCIFRGYNYSANCSYDFFKTFIDSGNSLRLFSTGAHTIQLTSNATGYTLILMIIVR